MNKRINTLEVLRCLAFIGVFLSHTGFLFSANAGTGVWGVSIFLVLSGFTMVYSYYGKERISAVSFTRNTHFAANKIKRLYPLHVITTLARAVLLLIGEDSMSVAKWGGRSF